MNSIRHKILEQVRIGSDVVLATVVRTSGSTPQKPGSSALFSEDGLIAGTVGGGALEGEVQQIASSVLISGVSNHYYFNLDTDQGGEGAICGGEAVVLIDANPGKHLITLEDMEKSLSQRKEGYLLTTVSRERDGGRTINRNWVTHDNLNSLPLDFTPEFKDKINNVFSDTAGNDFTELDIPSELETLHHMAFLEPLKPLPHLVIVGGGHVGKALAHLGRLLDFETTVIDDRPEFANGDNIPDADHFIVDEIGKSVSGLKKDPETYVVIVTRGHNHDAEALIPCIGSEAAYVGMIGSSHKVGVMKTRFLIDGLATPEQWSQIHTPIGLPIGSKTVQEIAISIAAQLVSIRDLKKKENAE